MIASFIYPIAIGVALWISDDDATQTKEEKRRRDKKMFQTNRSLHELF